MDQINFTNRRQALIEQVTDNSITIIHSAKEVVRNHDSHYPFRQDSDFYYLTGFCETDACLVLRKVEGKGEYILFCREKNYQQELWEGLRAGQEGARNDFGADSSFPISELPSKILELLIGIEHICFRLGRDAALDQDVPKWLASMQANIRKGISAPTHIHDVSEILSEMRLIKSEAEIAKIKKICGLSANAHLKAMLAAPTLKYEYQLQSIIEHHLMMEGCHHMAYNSIVASGGNACILHYTDNDKPLSENDLILIDAGGELENYAADITRTFPKSGKFSKEQKAIYQIVLAAQEAGIEMIKPGLAWNEIQQVMVEIISRGLIELGILKESLDVVIENKLYQKFYMHNSGHWLGLDVHDCGQYKEEGNWQRLKAGMVLTVEPGIYIADHHQDVEACWHNIGIRIEDDILVTEQGYENLTAAVPKGIDEIEKLMKAN